MNNGSIFLHYQISRIMSCIFWIYTHSVFIKCSHIEERVKAFPLFLYTISAKSSVIHDICRLSVHKNPQWRAMHVFAFLQALLPPSVHCGLDITPPPCRIVCLVAYGLTNMGQGACTGNSTLEVWKQTFPDLVKLGSGILSVEQRIQVSKVCLLDCLAFRVMRSAWVRNFPPEQLPIHSNLSMGLCRWSFGSSM